MVFLLVYKTDTNLISKYNWTLYDRVLFLCQNETRKRGMLMLNDDVLEKIFSNKSTDMGLISKIQKQAHAYNTIQENGKNI